MLFTATLPANATSTVNFLTNGVLFDTQTLTGGVATSLQSQVCRAERTLLRSVCAGDVNYFGSTNSLDQVVTNHPPNVSNVSYTRNTAVNIFNILVSDLLTNATDLDGDLLTLASVSDDKQCDHHGGWKLWCIPTRTPLQMNSPTRS